MPLEAPVTTASGRCCRGHTRALSPRRRGKLRGTVPLYVRRGSPPVRNSRTGAGRPRGPGAGVCRARGLAHALQQLAQRALGIHRRGPAQVLARTRGVHDRDREAHVDPAARVRAARAPPRQVGERAQRRSGTFTRRAPSTFAIRSGVSTGSAAMLYAPSACGASAASRYASATSSLCTACTHQPVRQRQHRDPAGSQQRRRDERAGEQAADLRAGLALEDQPGAQAHDPRSAPRARPARARTPPCGARRRAFDAVARPGLVDRDGPWARASRRRSRTRARARGDAARRPPRRTRAASRRR